ncbi:hypothetical protein Peetri_00178 [Pseudomonas phage vB_PpuM-Peetri]
MSVDFYCKEDAVALLPMARRVNQTTFFDSSNPGAGNCTEASVATLFGLTLEQIGRFYPGHEDPELIEEQRTYAFWRNLEEAFESRGMHLWRRDMHVALPTLYLAGGMSKRGCMHMVVMYDGEIIHDPHPSQTGLESVRHCFLPIVKDPLDFIRVLETK